MIVKSLELNNFRNYGSESIDFSNGVNILFGNNAQGKTNILEAIFYGCTTKSQKGSKEKELIRFGEEEAHIRLIVEKKGVDIKIDMHFKKNKTKGIAINSNPIRKAADLYGLVNIISFSPDDLQMIKNGPAERRRFIDMELCQLDKLYLYNLSNYNHVLAQKNNLLKQIESKKSLKDTLDVWDDQLVKFGTYIIEARKRYIDELNGIVKDIHSNLSLEKEHIEVKYIPDSDANLLQQKLFFNRDRDIILKSTSNGPHRDDIEFFINNENARQYGSQGQQRTVALSLKLAEIELVREKTKENPVLLLDDVLSELDRNRQNKLLDSISDIQTIITCTGLEEFITNRLNCDSLYRIKNGTIEKINNTI